jgi:uncharacterized protein
MTYLAKLIAAVFVGLAIAAGAVATVARAQASAVAAAIDAGTVGEQADGYLGVRGNVSAAIKSEVEAINIKRRSLFTVLAEQRGVTVKDVAAAVGCKTLATRVGAGEAYQLRDGIWHVRNGNAPIDLPAYCAS